MIEGTSLFSEVGADKNFVSAGKAGTACKSATTWFNAGGNTQVSPNSFKSFSERLSVKTTCKESSKCKPKNFSVKGSELLTAKTEE